MRTCKLEFQVPEVLQVKAIDVTLECEHGCDDPQAVLGQCGCDFQEVCDECQAQGQQEPEVMGPAVGVKAGAGDRDLTIEWLGFMELHTALSGGLPLMKGDASQDPQVKIEQLKARITELEEDAVMDEAEIDSLDRDMIALKVQLGRASIALAHRNQIIRTYADTIYKQEQHMEALRALLDLVTRDKV